MNWKRALIPAIFILPLLILVGSRFGSDPHAVPFVLGGAEAPAFSLRSIDGRDFSSAALRGKPIVLNFWSTWCVPCKTEHDILQMGASRYGDRVQFLGVVYQDTSDAAKEYLTKRLNRYPQLIDPDARVAIEYGVAGVPESFFIDPTGKVRHKEIGPVTPNLLFAKVDDMLTNPGGAVQ